jgi:hypothetical protein
MMPAKMDKYQKEKGKLVSLKKCRRKRQNQTIPNPYIRFYEFKEGLNGRFAEIDS